MLLIWESANFEVELIMNISSMNMVCVMVSEVCYTYLFSSSFLILVEVTFLDLLLSKFFIHVFSRKKKLNSITIWKSQIFCLLIFFSPLPLDMRDKMRKWREENYRNSEQIVDVGEELINEYASKLGDDSK